MITGINHIDCFMNELKEIKFKVSISSIEAVCRKKTGSPEFQQMRIECGAWFIWVGSASITIKTGM